MYRTRDAGAAQAAFAAEMRRRAGDTPPIDPLTEDWTAAERAAYAGLATERRSAADPVAADDPAAETAAAPAIMVRESLLALRDETPDDDDLQRAMAAVDGRRSAVDGRRSTVDGRRDWGRVG